MTISRGENSGLAIGEIPVDVFLDFARRHANSPEVGPIRTCFDHDATPTPNTRRYVFGLQGCERICAAASLVLCQARETQSEYALKLDSVIVDPALRKRGLASVLVAEIFANFLAETEYGIKSIYAHSVHPATVSMLRRLGFRNPPPVGAPISHLGIADGARDDTVATFEHHVNGRRSYMRLQCELCLTRSRRSRPWCKPDE